LNPTLECFRGLAALMVLVHHYSYLIDETLNQGGLHFFHTGVDLFFVITGLIFAPYLLGEVQQSVKAFAIRRAFRLYPLYLISIAIAVLNDWGQREGVATAAIKHLLFLQALPLVDLESLRFFSLIYWTLPVEVMFYILVAGALIAFRRESHQINDEDRAKSLVRRYGFVATLGFSLVYFAGFAPDSPSWVIRQAQLPALLLPFWFGMLIYFFRSSMEKSWPLRCFAVVSGGSLLFILYLVYPDVASSALTARPFGFFNLLSGVGYALVLGGFLASRGKLTGVWARLAIFAGACSYGVYLFHEWTLRVVLRLLPNFSPMLQVFIALVVVVVVAAILHRMIESPLRAYGASLAARAARGSA